MSKIRADPKVAQSDSKIAQGDPHVHEVGPKLAELDPKVYEIDRDEVDRKFPEHKHISSFEERRQAFKKLNIFEKINFASYVLALNLQRKHQNTQGVGHGDYSKGIEII